MESGNTFLNKIWRNKYIRNTILNCMGWRVSLNLKENENLMYIGNRKKYADIYRLGFIVKRRLWNELKKKLQRNEYLVITERSIKKMMVFCSDKECLKLMLVNKNEEVQEICNIYQYSIMNGLIMVLELLEEIGGYYKNSFLLDIAIRSGNIVMVKYVYENITKQYDMDKAVLNCFHNGLVEKPQHIMDYLIDNCGLVIGVNKFQYSNNKLPWHQIKKKVSTKYQRLLVDNQYLLTELVQLDLNEYSKKLADPMEIQYEMELMYKLKGLELPDSVTSLQTLSNEEILELYYTDLLLKYVVHQLRINQHYDIGLVVRVHLHYSIGYKNDISLLLNLFTAIGPHELTRSCIIYAIKNFNLNILNQFQANQVTSFYDNQSERVFYDLHSNELNKPICPLDFITQFWVNQQFNTNNFYKTYAILSVIQVYPLSIIKSVFQLVQSLIQQHGENTRPFYFTLPNKVDISLQQDNPNHLQELQVYLNEHYLSLFPPQNQINELMSVIKILPRKPIENISNHKKEDIQFLSFKSNQLSKYEKELLKGDFDKSFSIIQDIKKLQPSFKPTLNHYIIKSLGKYSDLDTIKTLFELSAFSTLEEREILFKNSYEKCNLEIVNYLVENDLVGPSFATHIIGTSSTSSIGNCFSKGDFKFIQYVLTNYKFNSYFQITPSKIIEKLLFNGKLSILNKLNDNGLINNNNNFNDLFQLPFIKILIQSQRIYILNNYLNNNNNNNNLITQQFVDSIINSKEYINNPYSDSFLFLKDKFKKFKTDDEIYQELYLNPNNQQNNNNCNLM